jgi:hypothetical protein
VLWGRSVFNSIRKFLQFQLTVNFVALVVAFVGAVAGGRIPLNVLQVGGPVQHSGCALFVELMTSGRVATVRLFLLAADSLCTMWCFLYYCLPWTKVPYITACSVRFSLIPIGPHATHTHTPAASPARLYVAFPPCTCLALSCCGST